jgi:hypothetical protein
MESFVLYQLRPEAQQSVTQEYDLAEPFWKTRKKLK